MGILVFIAVVVVIGIGVGLYHAHENGFEWQGPSDKS